MCGIFAYLNYLTPKTRREILDLLVNGLKRLEYRGYDSAGKFGVMQSDHLCKLCYFSPFCVYIPILKEFTTNKYFLGVGIDGPNDEGIILVKKKGKVKMLADEIEATAESLNLEKVGSI